jgi:hypothetical protein
MPRTLSALPVLLLVAGAPAVARAQANDLPRAADAPALAPRVEPASLAAPGADVAWAAPALHPLAIRAAEPGTDGSRSFVHRALFTMGGGVVGAWVGYVASQVVRSDWDKNTDGEFHAFRTHFALGGAALGGAMGAVFSRGHAHHEPAIPLAQRSDSARVWDGSRHDGITAEEIAQSGARDAFELVQSLRPTWLRPRGQETFRDNPTGVIAGSPGGGSVVQLQPGIGGVKVYMDEALLGDVSTLHEIPVVTVTGAEFITPAEATYRWGAGFSQGVIRLSSRPLETTQAQ